jgi:hypothetical protein
MDSLLNIIPDSNCIRNNANYNDSKATTGILQSNTTTPSYSYISYANSTKSETRKAKIINIFCYLSIVHKKKD